MQFRPASRRLTWLLGLGLLAAVGCKSELDDTPAADPLEDPWVDAIDEGDDLGAVAGAELLAVVDPATGVVAGESAGAETGGTAPTDPAADGSEDGTAAPPSDAAAPNTEGGAVSVAAKSGTSTGSSAGSGTAAANPSAAEAAVDADGTPAEAAGTPANPAAPAVDPKPAEPAKPAAPVPLTLADLVGDYRFVGGSTQRAELEAAIETAAEQLPAAIRGIGRKRLTKTNPIDDGLELQITGDTVKTIFSTGFDAACVIDGGTVHWTSKKGDKYKVRVRAKGAKIVQIIEGDDGVKTTVFVLSADKQRLTVHHKITADRLPEPMTYRLSYSRK